jgi:hypothetical protein
MSRPTRSFKLRLSPGGMDLLIDAHCHHIRSTRRLIAWGTTLHVAVGHLETLPAQTLVEALQETGDADLFGAQEYHLGAPNGLAGMATGIAERIRGIVPDKPAPSLGCIYLLALRTLLTADSVAIRATYQQMKQGREDKA